MLFRPLFVHFDTSHRRMFSPQLRIVIDPYLSCFWKSLPGHKSAYVFCANATKTKVFFLHIEKIYFSSLFQLFWSFFRIYLFRFDKKRHFGTATYIFVIFWIPFVFET